MPLYCFSAPPQPWSQRKQQREQRCQGMRSTSAPSNGFIITGIPSPIMVPFVFLIRIVGHWAVIAGISHQIPILIYLIGIFHFQTVIANISIFILVSIYLIKILC